MTKLRSSTSTALLGLGAAILGIFSVAIPALQGAPLPTLRPPSVPLVACDPYFSIWSPADNLNDKDTTHWTGKPHRLWSTVRIDGTNYRVMGGGAAGEAVLPQKSVTVLPTRTIYTFEGAGVALTLTFLTPALPEDIDILSRPVTYLTYDLRATDGKKHEVSIQLDASGEIAVNEPDQQVVAAVSDVGNSLRAVRVGSVAQPILAKRGDDLRIDWGYLYLAAPRSQEVIVRSSGEGQVAGGRARIGLEFAPLQVTAKPASRWLMLAYDDLYSIQFMKKNLRPYWRRNGWEAADLLKASAKEYAALVKRCEKFDTQLMADLTKAGGEKYAQISALAFRHCFAAGKFVADENGQPISFCKENHSNGCIGTSDVFYPMAPQFLLFGPSLAKSFLVPFMDYAASSYWKFPFAPHDLGTYPQANGQVYGDGEHGENNQMPVEESGNLLILMAAVAQMEGNADFAGKYWPQLEKWATYLKEKGFDPENQLCTDDFAGHMAHNVNLSAKAIVGIASFAKLCDMRGDTVKAAEYSKVAKEFAQRWVKEADSGDHYRLAFDKPNTWSQKYNATWDRILGLNLWPASTWRKEMDFYKRNQNRYGLPLDNRKDYTKLDWILWTATLTQNRADFEALVDPVYTFLTESPDRAPMPDWYQTKSAKKEGFTARPVVGGVFMQMLYDQATWRKWAKRDETKARNWAPIPKRPEVVVIVPAADSAKAVWSYAMNHPAANWFEAGFDDSTWAKGESGFGTASTPGARVGTVWNSRNIWLRREIELPAVDVKNLMLWVHHDEDVEVYINGVLALRTTGWTSSYEAFELAPAAKATLKPGKNLIAIHCRQSEGGQYVDLGFAALKTN
ncbi:MAG: DUF4965 domain-containing protein [Verrucomicrobiota bacterium]